MKKGRTLVLPHAQKVRLSFVCDAIERGDTSPAVFKGKRLGFDRRIVSIPLGRRWRAIFVWDAGSCWFREVMSHERYNKLNSSSSLV